jgi:hypothetical protein
MVTTTTALAAGEIVISTDADTVHGSDWLARIDQAFRLAPERVAVAGPCRFRYCVRSLTGDDDDEVACLYDEEHLQATGERAAASLFAVPRGFQDRQAVTVSAGFDHPYLAGRTGVVDGSNTGDGTSVAGQIKGHTSYIVIDLIDLYL